MKVSIIVPFYNAASTLEMCIDSLLQQRNDIEVILVNDHSTDFSESICQKYINTYVNIKYAVAKGKGVSCARNTGLKLVTGDVIGFCDADDTYAEGILEKVNEVFEAQKDISLVVTGYTRVYGKDRYASCFEKNCEYMFHQLYKYVIYDNRIMGAVWNKFFRKELLKNIYFDETLEYCEDMHFVMKVLSKYKNKKAVVLNCSGYDYTMSPNSATGINSVEKLFDKQSRLKYNNSLEAIKRDCNLSLWTKTIVNKKEFQIAYETWHTFDSVLKEEQRDQLKNIMRKNFINYLVHLFLGGVRKSISTVLWSIKNRVVI